MSFQFQELLSGKELKNPEPQLTGALSSRLAEIQRMLDLFLGPDSIREYWTPAQKEISANAERMLHQYMQHPVDVVLYRQAIAMSPRLYPQKSLMIVENRPV
jgi:hypothetical protein